MTREQLLTTITGFTILTAVVAITAWPEATATDTEERNQRRPVRVAQVAVGSDTETLRLSGVTRSVRHARLSFSLPARLALRPVEVGDRVAAGDLLARLDDREYVLAARAAEAAAEELDVRLTQSERDLDRVQRLVDARAATTEELERTAAAAAALLAARDAAEARVAETRRLVEESVLRAPFAGTVTAVAVEPGEWVSPGSPVVEIAGDGAVEVLVEAPESVYRRLAVGDAVRVELPFLGSFGAGTIAQVASAAGPGRLFPVEVTLDPDPRLAPGLTADVVFGFETGPETSVPLRAVVNPGSTQPLVFRIADGVAAAVPVELGRVRGDRVAVIADLGSDDLVAVSGHTALRDGDPVEVSR